LKSNLLEIDHSFRIIRTHSTSLLIVLAFVSLFFVTPSLAEDSHHARHRPKETAAREKTETYYTNRNGIVTSTAPRPQPGMKLTKTVYGFHPYWYGTAYNSYDFSLLSTVSYFSYHVDPGTGDQKGVFFWEDTPLIDMAKAAGSRIDLTITSFGNADNRLFLGNRTAQKHCIETVTKLLKKKNADGICIDFESIPSTMRNEFTNFVTAFSRHLGKEIPDATVSLALYAIDWQHVFDIPGLLPVVDQFILMAYDYHYSSSTDAGPIAPLQNGKIWPPFSVEQSVETYIEKGLPASKIILSVPYYGQKWQTKGKIFPSKNLGHLETIPYRKIVPLLQQDPKEWDASSFSEFLIGSQDDQISQLWYDGARSLKAKYQYAKAKGLAGVAIFALGYDNGHDELWQIIQDEFLDRAPPQ